MSDEPIYIESLDAQDGWMLWAAIEDDLREDYEDDRYDQQHAGAF